MKLFFANVSVESLRSRHIFSFDTNEIAKSVSAFVCRICRRRVLGPETRAGSFGSTVVRHHFVITTITVLCRDVTPEPTTGVVYRYFVLNLTLNFTKSAVLGTCQQNECV